MLENDVKCWKVIEYVGKCQKNGKILDDHKKCWKIIKKYLK